MAYAGKSRRGFTLIELLVVVSIISLLVSMLLPTLGQARRHSRKVLCLTRLGGQVRALYMYAGANRGRLPAGPSEPMDPPMPPLPYDSIATNQLWIGKLAVYNGCGALVGSEWQNENGFFCPDDDSSDPQEELEKLRGRGGEDAYGSYLYRQFDQAESARMGDLGTNDAGLAAKALLMDLNSLMPGLPERTNHRGELVNIGFVDGHAKTFENTSARFTLRPEDIANPFARLDEILQEADRMAQ